MKRLFVSALAISAATLSVAPGSVNSNLPFNAGSEPLTTSKAPGQDTFGAHTQGTGSITDTSEQDAPVDTTTQKVAGSSQTITATKKNSEKDDQRLITVMGATWKGDGNRHIEYRTRHAKAQTWGKWTKMPVSDDGNDPSSKTTTESTDAIVVAPYEVVQVKSDGPVNVSVSVTKRTDVDDLIAGGAIDQPIAPNGTQSEQPNTTPTPDQTETTDEPGITSANNVAYSADNAYKAHNTASVGGLKYVTRKQWGAKSPQCEIEHVDRNKAVVIHHTEGANGYSQSEVPGILRGIQAYHQQSRGWCDIGYNMLIDRFGKLYEGRAGGLNRATVGAHAVAVNYGTFGVSVMGSYSKPAPPAVIDSLSRVIRWQSKKWGWKVNSTTRLTSSGGPGAKKPSGATFKVPRVIGHRDVGYTDCPGNGLYRQIPQIRKLAAGDGTTAIDKYAKKHKLGKATSTERPMKNRKDATSRTYGKKIVVSHRDGTFRLQGEMLKVWKKMGRDKSKLGLPVSDTKCGLTDDGCYQRFEKGTIHWTEDTGAHPTYGVIRKAWAKNGYQSGKLGYPVSDPVVSKGVVSQDFQRGTITWSRKDGARVLAPSISGNVR